MLGQNVNKSFKFSQNIQVKFLKILGVSFRPQKSGFLARGGT